MTEYIDNLTDQIEDFRAMLQGKPDAGYSLTNGEILEYLVELATARAALAAAQPVTPDVRALVMSLQYYADNPDKEHVSREETMRIAANALASGVLGQPQPQPDRETIREFFHDKFSRHGNVCVHTSTLTQCGQWRDALLPLLGQPRTDAEES